MKKRVVDSERSVVVSNRKRVGADLGKIAIGRSSEVLGFL